MRVVYDGSVLRSGHIGVAGACAIGALLASCSSRSGGHLEPYVDGQFVCVDATATRPAGAQQRPPNAPSGCGTWPDGVLRLVQDESMCGPCGFELDAEKTASEREDHATVCCYLVSSPPPPGG